LVTTSSSLLTARNWFRFCCPSKTSVIKTIRCLPWSSKNIEQRLFRVMERIVQFIINTRLLKI